MIRDFKDFMLYLIVATVVSMIFNIIEYKLNKRKYNLKIKADRKGDCKK